MAFSLHFFFSLSLSFYYLCTIPRYVMATTAESSIDNATKSGSASSAGSTTKSTATKVRFYFIRHGESQANKWGLIAGQDDVPLTDGGISEAKLLGKSRWIHRDNERPTTAFWRVYSSDLSRARDTALLALKEGQQEHLIPALLQDAQLRERSYGLRQGFSRSMDEEEIRKIWQQYGRQPPPYETDEQLWERGRDWILQILKEVVQVENLETTILENKKGEDEEKVYHILVAAHAGFVREILLHLMSNTQLVELGAKFDAKRGNKLIIPNTSVSILEIDPFSSAPLETVKVIDLLNADHLTKVNVYDD